MIGYVTLGTNDLPLAAALYDNVLGVLGIKRFMDTERFITWAASPTTPGLGVGQPYDGDRATVGNGVMVALVVDTNDKDRKVDAKALALSGRDEGPPGSRGEGFYAGYLRDPDGNKLNVYCMGPAASSAI